MMNQQITNLNQVCKIVLVNKRKNDVFQWRYTISEVFHNLFKKKKVKPSSIKYIIDYYDNVESLIKENWFKKQYEYDNVTRTFYEKAHVTLLYSDYSHGKETRYFETDKEAKDYFNKLVTYAKQNNIPFINFYADK